ncbi:hypothetical protein OGM63_21365 [Plectonema radiosum NIES-515]|uniref:Uncharacterized protein n=1 Tax=Plectonema radiosum NIES-515 TaxID=2986073 RepID=A0ABT3B3S8_9CYAN|nr:hypothetical protein [Plectonema radiosum]MCV3216027.1 hypothetical protein [Plectonema radiosum NIES-515]
MTFPLPLAYNAHNLLLTKMPISNPNTNNSIFIPSPEFLFAASIDVTVNKTTSVSIITENVGRRGLTIFNAHSSTVYIDTTSHDDKLTFMFSLAPGAFYEMPHPALHSTLYAITELGSGKLFIREIRVLTAD